MIKSTAWKHIDTNPSKSYHNCTAYNLATHIYIHSTTSSEHEHMGVPKQETNKSSYATSCNGIHNPCPIQKHIHTNTSSMKFIIKSYHKTSS